MKLRSVAVLSLTIALLAVSVPVSGSSASGEAATRTCSVFGSGPVEAVECLACGADLDDPKVPPFKIEDCFR